MSVGQSLPHDSAREHVSGTSIFIDDRIPAKNEVLVDYVGSPVSAGKLKKVLVEDALKVPGVLAVLTATDLHHNRWGTIRHDQPFLVDDEIGYHDEPLCLVIAENSSALKKAKKIVRFEIEERPAVLQLEQAIENKNFLYQPKPMRRGNPEKAIVEAPYKLKGTWDNGGQEHFYLETQAAVAYPLEDNQIEVHSSSQHPTEVQHVVAEALGLAQNNVVCVVKRMGGGFGGKESQAGPFAVFAALAAAKLKRPARLVLHQEDDFRVTGKRHPFKCFYEVGFDGSGKILGLKAELYSNGGAYLDLSASIFDRALYHSDGCYYIENMHVEGAVCKTNQHSNTAFRGFGGPQGNMMTENIMEEIALTLKKDAFDIRRLNLYGVEDRNVTHYGQTVSKNKLPEIFTELLETSNYRARVQDISRINRSQMGLLRGISMTGVKFGIAFTARFLNQGNALVNVHRDGSVQVSTGATEMGQGVNTKIKQVVAEAFSIQPDRVRVMATSTEKNHNTSPTAASSGADINAAAALKAADGLKERLRWVYFHHLENRKDHGEIPSYESGKYDLDHLQFKDEFLVDTKSGQKFSWIDIVTMAYQNRISLGEYAHFKTEGLHATNPFRYFTMGAAVTEVEINEYTGEYKILRSDVLMDLGRPINPGIDLGQVTGAFIQGVGWVTTENLYYDEKGALISRSPTTYKIPNIQDTPRIFNVNLIENKDHDEAVYRSKAVGEPPLLLGTSAIMAIKNALSYRTLGKIPHISSPATSEVVLMELAKHDWPQL